MAELTPYPFGALVQRAFHELEHHREIFDLAERNFVLGAGRDLAVPFHGHRASSPLGPAAGPQTQMAQNIVLSWLGGSRILELKTVQIRDELEIPRPCIDMQTVGLNIEWSQELKLEQSLEEYVKGAMLVEMLAAGPLVPAEGFGDLVYDLSVGYDLAGIRTERVQAFIHGMLDAGETIERFRAEIPSELGHLQDLDFRRRLSDTVTLSTFHGCPPEEIEQIIEFLLREVGLHSIIKFNPMLLGPETARGLLHDQLGYDDFRIPDSAFERDTRWEQAVGMMERLGESAAEVGLGLGAKFTNTLIVTNDRGFLSGEVEEAYLSGPPLHVLAVHLVRRFRREFGDRFPISFSAGIDRSNVADALAIGLVPITICSDLLKKGGYGRLSGYYQALESRMAEVGAGSIDDFVLLAYGHGAEALARLDCDPETSAACRSALGQGAGMREAAGEVLYERWVSEAKLLNTETYVERLDRDERYSRAANLQTPRKIGRHLQLFDCISCDICVPVCPNDANFTFGSPDAPIPIVKVTPTSDGWTWRHEADLALEERHQIANFADFCNDCGNCDIFCPEDGGPYVIKPRFFGSESGWREATNLDGFFVEHGDENDRILGRFGGVEYTLEVSGATRKYEGEGFRLTFAQSDPEGTLVGEGNGEIDLTYCFIMDYVRRAVLDDEAVNYVNSLRLEEPTGE
jgi:putative selenate reductase